MIHQLKEREQDLSSQLEHKRAMMLRAREALCDDDPVADATPRNALLKRNPVSDAGRPSLFIKRRKLDIESSASSSGTKVLALNRESLTEILEEAYTEDALTGINISEIQRHFPHIINNNIINY